MGSIFSRKINEPQLDTLEAKRILEKTFEECGFDVTSDVVEAVLKPYDETINYKMDLFRHKAAGVFEKRFHAQHRGRV